MAPREGGGDPGRLPADALPLDQEDGALGPQAVGWFSAWVGAREPAGISADRAALVGISGAGNEAARRWPAGAAPRWPGPPCGGRAGASPLRVGADVVLRDLVPREQDVDADERLRAHAPLAHRPGLGQAHAERGAGLPARWAALPSRRRSASTTCSRSTRTSGRSAGASSGTLPASVGRERVHGQPHELAAAGNSGGPGAGRRRAPGTRTPSARSEGAPPRPGGRRRRACLPPSRAVPAAPPPGRPPPPPPRADSRLILSSASRSRVSARSRKRSTRPISFCSSSGTPMIDMPDVEAQPPGEMTGKSRRFSARSEAAGHGLPELVVVAEELDRGAAHAIGERDPERVQGGAVGEGDDALGVGGDEPGDEAVQDRLREAAAVLHAAQRGLRARACARPRTPRGRRRRASPSAAASVTSVWTAT